MVVTISNQYGAHAIAIAHAVAEQLGYELIDEQLPVVVAKRLQTSPQMIESAEEGANSVGDRVMRALESGTPEVASAPQMPSFDDEVLREVEETVREYAAKGDVVIVGRGGSAILGRGRGVLRVFMHAPRDWRVAHVSQAFGTEPKIAAAEIDRIDRARSKYIEVNYGLRWADAANYDLAIDVASTGSDGACELIVAAVRRR